MDRTLISILSGLGGMFGWGTSDFRGQPLSILQVPAIALILLGVILVSVNFNYLKQGTVSLLKGVKETLLANK